MLLLSMVAASPAAAKPAAVAGRPPSCDGSWHVVSSPNPWHDYGDADSLSSVATLSPRDAWAVGFHTDFDTPYGFQTLAEHWNGRTWQHVPTPDSTKTTWDQLNGVVSIAPDDVWAVGNESTGPYGSLIEHWDGTSWSIQDDGTPRTYLTSVSGLGPNDLWAAGSTNYVGFGLIDHWNGISWTRTVLPVSIYFRAIKELAPNDIWAVGQESTGGFGDNTAAYHYDGATWTRYSTPNPLQVHTDDQNWLTSIAAISPNDVWALGVSRDPDYGIRDHPFTIHWDGSSWSLVRTPDPGGSRADTDLWGAVPFATDDIWAVGRVGVDPTWHTFTAHWDGSTWTSLRSSTPGEFLATARDGLGGLWGVGDQDAQTYRGIATLVEHLCFPKT